MMEVREVHPATSYITRDIPVKCNPMVVPVAEPENALTAIYTYNKPYQKAKAFTNETIGIQYNGDVGASLLSCRINKG